MVRAQMFSFLVPVMLLWVATAIGPAKFNMLQFDKGRRYVCVEKYNAKEMIPGKKYCLSDAREAIKVSQINLKRVPSNFLLRIADYRKCISGKNTYQMKFCSWKGEYPDPDSQVSDEDAHTLSGYYNPRRLSYDGRIRLPKSCFLRVNVQGSIINGVEGAVEREDCEKMMKAKPESQDIFTEKLSDAQMAHDVEESGGEDAEPEYTISDYYFKNIKPASKVEDLVGWIGGWRPAHEPAESKSEPKESEEVKPEPEESEPKELLV